MNNEETEQQIDAMADVLARVVIAGLIGLGFWCFGTPAKVSLGIAVIGFFLSFIL